MGDWGGGDSATLDMTNTDAKVILFHLVNAIESLKKQLLFDVERLVFYQIINLFSFVCSFFCNS